MQVNLRPIWPHLIAANEAYQVIRANNILAEGGETTETFMHPTMRDAPLSEENARRAVEATGKHQRKLLSNKKTHKAWLKQMGLQSTEVSGDGLNCLINALFQHATWRYHQDKFKEAKKVRGCIQSGPEMLQDDDQRTKEVLTHINQLCETNLCPSFVQANNDGRPGIISTIGDPAGNHVVI